MDELLIKLADTVPEVVAVVCILVPVLAFIRHMSKGQEQVLSKLSDSIDRSTETNAQTSERHFGVLHQIGMQSNTSDAKLDRIVSTTDRIENTLGKVKRV